MNRWFARLLATLVAIGASADAAAAQRLVSGKVLDSLQRPVALVHVYLVDSRGDRLGAVGAMTDANGWYTLRLSASDTGRIAIRRIGFYPEPPRAVEWAGRDVATLNWTMVSTAQRLTTVRITPGGCQAVTSLNRTHPVREMWNEAVATVAARQAFLESYEYRVRWVRKETRPGGQSRVTDDSLMFVSPPQPDIEPGFRDQPLGKYGPPGRSREVSAWAPIDRALLDSVFVARFCFDDAVTWVGDSIAQVTMRETVRQPGEVVAVGTLGFRVNATGLAIVSFRYTVNERELGTAAVFYSHAPVEGTTFPLESSASIQLRDPATGRALSGATTTSTYTEFKRIPPSEPISAAPPLRPAQK